jgi:hypothetical protein
MANLPSKTQLAGLGAGLVVAAALVVLILFIQQGSTPRLAGEITSVRTLGMDESSSVAIVDFHFTNSSKYPFVVGSSGISVVDSKGGVRQGQVISAAHLHELFDLFPALGRIMGEPLIDKTKIPPGGTATVMLAARFEMSKPDLDARKKITVSIADVDGPVSELSHP